MSDKLECSAPSINLHQFDKECHVCGFVACHAQLQLRNSEISLLQLKLVCLGCSKSRLTSRSTYYLWLSSRAIMGQGTIFGGALAK